MKITIEIELENEAFQLNWSLEAKRLAVLAVQRAWTGVDKGKLLDVNGNTCGQFELVRD